MTKTTRKLRAALTTTTALIISACSFGPFSVREEGPATEAWAAWKAGDFKTASSIAQELASDPATTDAALKVLTLTAHITGDYEGAITAFERLDPEARRDEKLEEAVFESLLHLGRVEQAYAMVKERGAGNPAYLPYYNRAKTMAQYPLKVEIDRTFELPFVQSEITDFFPGVTVSLNGVETTARFDTGGAFIHMSPSQAKRFGVTATDCSQGFASLQTASTCIGIVKQLTIGDARLYNIPVAVMEVMENSPLSEIDDSPILGTNIFQQFLVTIDAPGQRFIVSARQETEAKREHLARLNGNRQEIPFVMWGDHFMIARGVINTQKETNFFVDSGLVFGTAEYGQAAILTSKSMGGKWKKLGSSGMSRIPGTLGLGPLTQTNTTAMVVPNGTWRKISESMGGVRVDALLSYGFLKNYAWTIDFDRRVYLFTDVK